VEEEMGKDVVEVGEGMEKDIEEEEDHGKNKQMVDAQEETEWEAQAELDEDSDPDGFIGPNSAKRQKPHSSRAPTPRAERTRRCPPSRSRPENSDSPRHTSWENLFPNCPTTNGTTATFETGYQEWPFKGFLKRTKIGPKTFHTMEFCLDSTQSALSSVATTQGSRTTDSTSFSSSRCSPEPTSLQPKRSRFTAQEDAQLINLKETKGLSWKEIEPMFSNRSIGTLRVHHSTKLKATTTMSRKKRRS